MHGLAETISKLGAMRAMGGQDMGAGRLQTVTQFGANPGGLTMKGHVPQGLPPKSPLVVVLHGCTQTADSYDRGSGWSALADEQGFAVLYPEQQRANNPNLCFNWFQPGDTTRDAGELASIREMIATMILTYDLDPKRVFITGLSAGGAMTAAMLAACPELFAGGAIVAGLPAGSAATVSEALQQMRSPGPSPARAVRDGSRHKGPWPTISVWHGDADRTVDAANADAIVRQWLAVHGVQSAGQNDSVDGHRRTAWRDANGREVVEHYAIGGMGHGVPLAGTGPDALGVPGAYALDAGISSTRHIARFWGIGLAAPLARSNPVPAPAPAPAPAKGATLLGKLPLPRFSGGPGQVIEDALRAAGLMSGGAPR